MIVPPARRRVLVDTSAYFALANPRDASHHAMGRVGERLAARRYATFTTNFILAETHALLLTRARREVALKVLTDIEDSANIVVRVSARDERRARAILRSYSDKDFSLTDATSFAVMERLGIQNAFTLDHHFEQYGFTIVSAESPL